MKILAQDYSLDACSFRGAICPEDDLESIREHTPVTLCIAAACQYWNAGGEVSRKIKWATYRDMRSRALVAERRANALEELINLKTGLSSYEHLMVDATKLSAESPRAKCRLTGMSMPTHGTLEEK